MARSGGILQLRRGLKSAITAASGTLFAAGEPVWATDTGELYIADGTNTPNPVSRSFNGVGNPPTGTVVMPFNAITVAAGAPVTGTLALMPIDIWPGPLTIKALVSQVTTAQVAGTGTLNQAVIYRDNGTGAGPLVTAAGLLANVATVATSTGIKLTTITNLLLTPGRYWVGLLYYQGTTAPTTAPQYMACTSSTTLYTTSASFAAVRFLSRTGLTTVPVDGVAFTPASTNVQPLVGVQAI